jgi:3-hydroxyisobutyrate dehydrogenase
MQSIAFLGLGAMGSRMAANLAKAGHKVTVWNRDPAKAAALVGLGCNVAGTPRAAAAAADLVFSMVTDDDAARRVWLDPQTGALAGLGQRAVAIECSTVTPRWIAELHAAVAARGAALLDAPVAGSRPQAEAGQLVFMVGGDAEAFARVEPILAPLAARVMHVGGSGQGAVLKLALNAFFAAQLESMAELLGFLARSGFEPMQAADLLATFPIVAPPLAGAARMMAARDKSPLFTIDLIEKDLRYVIEAAAERGSELPGAAASRGAFMKAKEAGHGSSNVSALAMLFAPH